MDFQNIGMTNPHSPRMMYPLFITSEKQKHFCSFNKSFEARQFWEYTSARGEASVFYISLSGGLKKPKPAARWLKFIGTARCGGVRQGEPEAFKNVKT